MIIIREKTPVKMPGITSLFIEFDYTREPEVAQVIKTCTPCYYNKKTRIWEIPSTRLAKFINGCTGIDDIELNIKKDKILEPEHKYKLSDYKTTPYPYQKDGILYGLNHQRFLLLDAPGLGKTLQIIYLAQELKKRENIKHCLIICGLNTLKTNWEKEINKHSDLSCRILGKRIAKTGTISYGSIPDRIKELKSKIKEFFVIINVETLRNDEVVKLINSGPNKFDMIAFDEIHCCKSHQSSQGHNLLKLTAAQHKIGLTGTVLLNNPLDCFVPLTWIGVNKGTWTNFKIHHCDYGGLWHNEFLGYRHIDDLKDQLASCSIRRTKDLLDLPEKNIINEYLDMEQTQAKFYTNIVEGVLEQVDKVKIRSANLLALIARLRQATACPNILTTENIPSVKLDRCTELVNELVSNNEQVVVFSTFKETLNCLKEKLKDYNPYLCTGDVADSIISKNIDEFQSGTGSPVMLATWQKMGTGVTLNKASYAIFIDTPFTAGQYEQSCDRVHRIGSKRPVFIYNLICNNTFDTRVHDLIISKAAISDYVVDDKIDIRTFDILKNAIKELN